MNKLRLLLVAASVLGFATASNADVITNAGGNLNFATAQNLDGAFSLDFKANIGDITGLNTSESIAHATVIRVGSSLAQAQHDWFSFNATLGSTIILDIDDSVDHTGGGSVFDSFIRVYQTPTSIVALNDDGGVLPFDSTLDSAFDSFLQFEATYTGTYAVEVSKFFDGPVQTFQDYKLHVSVSSVPDSGTTAAMLGAAFLAMLGIRARSMRSA